MNSRISDVFLKTRAAKRAALIPFIMGYDPDRETTLAVLSALVENGADLIEIGMPFSDPMADGPVIQAAGLRALSAGATVAGILSLVKEFRAKHANVPIILMGYYNPIYSYGGERFCKDAADAGVDGLILVDLPPEEENELTPYLDAAGLSLIRLVAPTSGEDRLKKLAASASGFIYYISVTGITGAKTAEAGALSVKLAAIRAHTTLPVAVGFGIKTGGFIEESPRAAQPPPAPD
ncbi:MAG: tryptophan synthase subunit alpha, partial [Rickettsiales bacterium]|nr:tryptophan synthase subunit alpha [Rickettsiales bacterium]